MKKLLIAMVAIILIAPFAAKAQTVDTSNMTNDQLRTYLIILIQEVIQLEQQLIAMQNTQPTPVAQVATPVAQPPVVVPLAQPIATIGQAPIIAGAPAPQPSGYKIQIIAWPGPVNSGDASARTFLANPTSTIDRPGRVEAPDGSYADLGAILIDPSGKAVSDANMEVITPDPNQNTEIIGTGNVYGNPAVPYYAYSYAFKTIGSHTITFTAMGATNQITLQAN